MNNKKVYITLIVIIIIYLGIVLGLYKLGIFDNKNSYIIFNDKTILSIEKNKYTYMNDNDIINKKKFAVYDYNEYLGEYNVKIDDNTYKVYDDNYNLVKFKTSFIAIYSPKNKVKMNTNKKESLSQEDFDILKKVLSENNIENYTYLLTAEKRQVKIDENKYIYVYNVSNSSIINNDNKYFSIIFTVDNNQYNVLKINVVDKEEYNNSKIYSIEAIIDMNNDEKDEIVINTFISSQNGTTEKEIYTYSDNKYQKIEVEKSK